MLTELFKLAGWLGDNRGCDVDWRIVAGKDRLNVIWCEDVAIVAEGAKAFGFRASYSAGTGWEFVPEEERDADA